MKHISIIPLIICLLFQITKAQNSFIIKTITGDSIFAHKIESLSDEPSVAEIKYISFKKKKNIEMEKWSFIDRSEVFSIKSPDNIETILYAPLFEGDRTVKQMQEYLKGDAYARQLSTTGIFFIGFAGGLTALSIPPDRPYFFTLMPLATVVGIGIFSPTKLSPSDDFDFDAGYKFRRKKKNVKTAIWGAIAGTATGILSSFFVYDFIGTDFKWNTSK